MRIFISWSGEVSHKVAVSLREWLPSILQAVQIFVSSEDIEKGIRWFNEIGAELEQIEFGILCLTPHNLLTPWILFEAGAISKHLGQSRLAPLLIGLSPSDLNGPLAQFNATSIKRDDIKKLVKTINSQLTHNQLDKDKLDRTFDKWWPDLEQSFVEASSIAEHVQSQARVREKRNVNDILEEILEISRSTAIQLSKFTDIMLGQEQSSGLSLQEREAFRKTLAQSSEYYRNIEKLWKLNIQEAEDEIAWLDKMRRHSIEKPPKIEESPEGTKDDS